MHLKRVECSALPFTLFRRMYMKFGKIFVISFAFAIIGTLFRVFYDQIIQDNTVQTGAIIGSFIGFFIGTFILYLLLDQYRKRQNS